MAVSSIHKGFLRSMLKALKKSEKDGLLLPNKQKKNRAGSQGRNQEKGTTAVGKKRKYKIAGFEDVKLQLMLFQVFGEEHLPHDKILNLFRKRRVDFRQMFALRKVLNPAKWVQFLVYFSFELVVRGLDFLLEVFFTLLTLPRALFRRIFNKKEGVDHVVAKIVDWLFVKIPLGIINTALALTREVLILLLNSITSPVDSVVPALRTFFTVKPWWQALLFVFVATLIWSLFFTSVLFIGSAALPAFLAPLSFIIHPLTLVFSSVMHGLTYIGLSVPFAKGLIVFFSSMLAIRLSHDLCSGAIKRFGKWVVDIFKDDKNNALYGGEKDVLVKERELESSGSIEPSLSHSNSDGDTDGEEEVFSDEDLQSPQSMPVSGAPSKNTDRVSRRYVLNEKMPPNALGHLLQGTTIDAMTVDPDHRHFGDFNNPAKWTTAGDNAAWAFCKFFGWQPFARPVMVVDEEGMSPPATEY